ncbi:MAG TPA: EF-P beta-lysylation protein EpmB [Pseudomonadales bacterium]|nr:EF-P beta-lysylation protein EpmB [Pseudomonadales bacterium]
MIPVSPVACQELIASSPSWQSILQDAITDPHELCRRLSLSNDDESAIADACRAFPLKVPEPYLSRIKPGNARDPLLLQVLPQASELHEWPGFVSDPLDERQFNPVPGLVHKYSSRALLITTSLCAIHCRYCFRREFPYESNRNSRQDWQQPLDYIRQHDNINEVILSGGDPLSLPDRQLAWLTEQIASIPHVKRLRIHTRLPIVIPQRITQACTGWMTQSRLQTIVVLHSNHPDEIDDNVGRTIATLCQTGITVLNQSVLLSGINDSADTLALLSERLFDFGCLPYYLHALDAVRGSHHFALPDEKARQIHRQLQARLPGFLVPRLVRELPGRDCKTLLA